MQFKMIRKQDGGDGRKVDPVVNGAFEGQCPCTVAKREHTNGYAVCQVCLAIRARLRVGDNGLNPTIRNVGDANRGKIEAVQEGGVVKRRCLKCTLSAPSLGER
jgi:hypothetical protein